MKSTFLLQLHCPFCGGPFAISHGEESGGEVRLGLLTCGCGVYPLVAGIPVLRKDAVAQKAVELVRSGRDSDALFTLLAPAPPALAHRWVRSLPSLPVLRWIKNAAHRQALDEFAAKLAPDLTAVEVLHLYFRNTRENYNYLSYRFGQPRHLVALSFASLIPPGRPVLDVGCGCGHITHSLAQRARGELVVGIDEFFFGLYLGKHWIAPAAEYVCCAADAKLPFADGTFSAAFSSDSFHYFTHKDVSLGEMARVTGPEGLILLAGMHNAQVQRLMAYGLPLPPAGYEALAGKTPHRLVADRDVLARYFEKLGPPLAAPAGRARLDTAPLLSLALSHRPEVFADHGTFADWPHAQGRLGVNLLYREEGPDSAGNFRLQRTFPSALYEADHAEIKAYIPESVEVSPATLAELSRGERTPGVERLLAQCVVLGMPERYH